ncbi:MAG: HD domain-containing protein [Armatimonadetes bacterium]|nr:HD domain-containing protein [Armatimonadota bacterium]
MLRQRLIDTLRLKALPRAGWVRVGVEAPESVAAHSWGVAWLALNLCPPELDREKALAIALVHDLAEVVVGDITPHDPIAAEDKQTAELEAFTELVRPLERAGELRRLMREYLQDQSAEARFVKACDKLDMALQAALYQAEQGLDLQEFVDSALSRLEDSELARLARP